MTDRLTANPPPFCDEPYPVGTEATAVTIALIVVDPMALAVMP